MWDYNKLKNSLINSVEVMGWVFIIFIISSLLYPHIFSLTLTNRYYLIVFFVAVFIGNIIREYKKNK